MEVPWEDEDSTAAGEPEELTQAAGFSGSPNWQGRHGRLEDASAHPGNPTDSEEDERTLSVSPDLIAEALLQPKSEPRRPAPVRAPPAAEETTAILPPRREVVKKRPGQSTADALAEELEQTGETEVTVTGVAAVPPSKKPLYLALAMVAIALVGLVVAGSITGFDPMSLLATREAKVAAEPAPSTPLPEPTEAVKADSVAPLTPLVAEAKKTPAVEKTPAPLEEKKAVAPAVLKVAKQVRARSRTI